LAKSRAVFAIPAKFFPMILHYDFFYFFYFFYDVWKISFHWILEPVGYTVYNYVRIAFDMIALRKVIWLIFIEVPELGTRFYKINILIKSLKIGFV
jgi:hypothetical protein